MRKLKFRVWDTKRNKWLHSTENAIHLFGEMIAMGEIFCCMDDNYSVPLTDINTLRPMQFTGMLDRSGKEIYEDDIVADPALRNYQVIMKDGCWVIDTKDRPYTLYHQPPDFLAVVGNIYENPEMLNAKQ